MDIETLKSFLVNEPVGQTTPFDLTPLLDGPLKAGTIIVVEHRGRKARFQAMQPASGQAGEFLWRRVEGDANAPRGGSQFE